MFKIQKNANIVYTFLQVLVWNTNFDKEVLAKPLLTSNNMKTEKSKEEKKDRYVDARLSFSGMEQPDVEVNGYFQ